MRNIYFLAALLIFVLAGSFFLLNFSKFKSAEPKPSEINQEIMFNGSIIKAGDVFNLNPNDHCVGDMKLQISAVYANSVNLEVLEEQQLNRTFSKLETPNNITLKDGECVFAPPLCMDVAYYYCFSVDTSNNPPIYSYEIKGKSTMPR